MNYKKVLDNAPDTYFLIKDKNNKVIYPKDKRKLDYIRKIYINYSKENAERIKDDVNIKTKLQSSLILLNKMNAPEELILLVRKKIKELND